MRVVVFAKGEKEREAREAGADIVGAEDLVEKIQGGWLEFDTAVATPDLMGQVGRLGKVLGPRGLMPNPKLGTVTFDVGRAVREVKAGKVEFRVDKAGNVHVPVGKRSFAAEQLAANAHAPCIEAHRAGEAGGGQGAVPAHAHGVDDHGARRHVDVQRIASQFKKPCRRSERADCREGGERSRSSRSGWAASDRGARPSTAGSRSSSSPISASS